MAENSSKSSASYLPVWWSRDINEIQSTLTRIMRDKFNTTQAHDIFAAQKIANAQHKGQKRAGGEDYAIHPFRVAISMILEFSVVNSDIVIAALLHDLLENTNYSHHSLIKRFGENIYYIICALTRIGKHPKTGEKLNDIYFQNIIRESDNCILIKIADKLDNIRDALNHPSIEKRKLYVKETYEVYFPLVMHLTDRSLSRRIIDILQETMENHSFYRKYFSTRHFLIKISGEFDLLRSGDSILYSDLERNIPEIDKHLNIFLLFNPNLQYWLNIDHVQAVKISANSETIVSNVCYKIIRMIEQHDIGELIEAASISSVFADPTKYMFWIKTKEQLTSLITILKMPFPPPWLQPLIGNMRLLLLVVHSRLFLPPNLDSPLWQDGSIIALKDKEVYKGIVQNDSRAEEFGLILYSLLCRREALWRYHTGRGSFGRANQLFEVIKDISSSKTCSFEELLSMRLLVEFLDLTVLGDISEDTVISCFSELWEELGQSKKKQNDNLLNHKPNRRRFLYGFIPGDPEKDISNLEIVGFDRVRSLCEGRKLQDNLSNLLRILSLKAIETKNSHLAWLYFDVLEIMKRERYFLDALTSVQKDTDFDSLKAIGIEVHESSFKKNKIFTIVPSKWLALKNRLPELTESEIKRISRRGFSAVAIFNTLLMDKLDGSCTSPLFMPRVFRVLDTMADFDSINVQGITVFFDSHERIKDFKVYLPIPRNSDEGQMQERRKNILSRFIATTIFNYAVTIGIYSAYVDCDFPLTNREEFCFTNNEIERQILAHASDYGFTDAYGSFVQNFNFKAFDIRSRVQMGETVSFTKEDMRNGNFLGVDIGGTDTKMCLVQNGKAEKLLKTIPTFEAGAKPIDASHFCDRLISEFTSSLPDRFLVKEIDGIGISWPGAVRNSKIVGFSSTLGSIKPPGLDMTLNPKSLPQEIQSVDIPRIFLDRLTLRFPEISDCFAAVIENDGNAEAFGNYCALETAGRHQTGGKLVIKLGTSLAGGHIDSYGAISSHQVSEFSKVIMNFNVPPPDPSRIEGAAREFVSSKGVRELSRNFLFNEGIVFGSLLGKNASDTLLSRLESVELGGLLTLWSLADDDNLDNNRFLDELTESDNKFGKERYQALMAKIVKDIKTGQPNVHEYLKGYIKTLGMRQNTLKTTDTKGTTCDDAPPNGPDSDLYIWRLGLNRLNLICSGHELQRQSEYEEIPGEFSFEVLADKVLGSVALFSQLGLHIAHLIVLLYNIYRKERFSEVILTGGVLGKPSGLLVKHQTEAFLLKYYDKVYGSGKNIELESVVLAHNDVPAVVGPYGAAMLANRVHKVNGLAQMRKILDSIIHNLQPGSEISFTDICKATVSIRCDENNIRTYLDRLVARSILVPNKDDEDVYLRALST